MCSYSVGIIMWNVLEAETVASFKQLLGRYLNEQGIEGNSINAGKWD